jgi:hypothetical protein
MNDLIEFRIALATMLDVVQMRQRFPTWCDANEQMTNFLEGKENGIETALEALDEMIAVRTQELDALAEVA